MLTVGIIINLSKDHNNRSIKRATDEERNHPHPSNPFHTASYPTSSNPTVFQSQNYAKFATCRLLQPAELASTHDTHAQLRVSGQ